MKGKGKKREIELGLIYIACSSSYLPAPSAPSSVRCSEQMVGRKATNGSFCDAGLLLLDGTWKNVTAIAIYLAHTDQNKNHVENRAIGGVGAQIENIITYCDLIKFNSSERQLVTSPIHVQYRHEAICEHSVNKNVNKQSYTCCTGRNVK